MKDIAKLLGIIIIAAPFVIIIGIALFTLLRVFIANIFTTIPVFMTVACVLGGIGLLISGNIIGIFVIAIGVILWYCADKTEKMSEKWYKFIMRDN